MSDTVIETAIFLAIFFIVAILMAFGFGSFRSPEGLALLGLELAIVGLVVPFIAARILFASSTPKLIEILQLDISDEEKEKLYEKKKAEIAYSRSKQYAVFGDVFTTSFWGIFCVLVAGVWRLLEVMGIL